MRQMELSRLVLARLSPRLNELTVLAETMYAAVSVAVGHIEVTGGPRHQLGGMIERPRRAQWQVVPVLATGIGVLAARPQLLDQLAIERVDHRHIVGLVGQVNQIVDDSETVGTLELSGP